MRFSTTILFRVLALLAATSAILLTTAYLGSEKALQHEIINAYERDQRALNSLLEAQFKNIQQISQEVSKIHELRQGLSANDAPRIALVIESLLAGTSGQYIDALVVEDKDGPSIVSTNVSLLDVQLPLKQISQRHSPLGTWTSINTEGDDKLYSLLQLTLPIIDGEFGEVIGKLHTFVLLNDNYWIINQLQSLFGSHAISLSYGANILAGLESEQRQLHNLRAPAAIPKGVLNTGNSILREHDLRIGISNNYSVRTLLPNSTYLALRDAYITNLFEAALLVVILGIVTMLDIRHLTRRSLLHLTRYAEQVPENGSPQPFSGGRFHEFIRVGNAIETMLVRIRDRDKHLSSIIDNSPDLIFIKDLEHNYQLVNKRFAEVLRTTPEQLIGNQDQGILTDDLMAQTFEADQQVLHSHRPTQYEMEIETNNGLSTFLVSKFPIIDDQDKPFAVGGIATDITNIKQAENQLQLAQQVFAETAEAIIVLDDKQNVLSSNRAFFEMSGIIEHDTSTAIQSFLAAHPEILQQLKHAPRWQGEGTLECFDGSALPVLVSMTHLSSEDGENRCVILFSDITDLKVAEQRLERLAQYDSLTGLPNRSLFNQRLEKALNSNSQLITAVMFIDLDRFKNINDTYGHSVGDELLHQVADRLRSCVQAKDTVSRLGGDEFTVILCKIHNRNQVKQIAQRILAVLSEPYELDSIRCFSSASIGIVLATNDSEDTDTLTRNADQAMYQAKEAGRDVIQFYDQALSARDQRRHHYEEDLRKALDNNELFIQYQPRFDIEGQEVLGAEALLRWRHPEHGLVHPDEFIPIAEASNLIIEIGRFVLCNACQQAAAWNTDGYQIPVSVNLSPRQLCSQDLLRDIKAALNLASLPARFLELEITETHVIENIDQVLPVLNRIRAMDVKLSLDDFGTGYSSLMYLKKLPVATVKIDRSFIKDIPGDTDDETLVQAIISMSHSLRLRVVAEGVETKQQQDFLRDQGCDELQGFLLGRPDSVEQLKVLADSLALATNCEIN